MEDKILLSHGEGGYLTNRLINDLILKYTGNEFTNNLNDSACFQVNEKKLCFTTDSFVVNPIFFPGGDIGSLAVYGTVNDLAVSGARPLYLSLSFIIEEGFEIKEFEKILRSIKKASEKAKIKIITGDTKVVPKGNCDKIFINTSGIGIYDYHCGISPAIIEEDDVIIINKSIGEHGLAVLLARENFQIDAEIFSDSRPLNIEIEKLKREISSIHCMRDVTRGGLATVLKELAESSKKNFEIFHENIPVKDEVKGVCEILGFDPLYIANEGVFVIFVKKDDAKNVLKILKDGKIIGRVLKEKEGRVFLKTSIGGVREIDMITNSLIPRIC